MRSNAFAKVSAFNQLYSSWFEESSRIEKEKTKQESRHKARLAEIDRILNDKFKYAGETYDAEVETARLTNKKAIQGYQASAKKIDETVTWLTYKSPKTAPTKMAPAAPDIAHMQVMVEKTNDSKLWARTKRAASTIATDIAGAKADTPIKVDGYYSRRGMLADLLGLADAGRAYYDNLVRQSNEVLEATKKSAKAKKEEQDRRAQNTARQDAEEENKVFAAAIGKLNAAQKMAWDSYCADLNKMQIGNYVKGEALLADVLGVSVSSKPWSAGFTFPDRPSEGYPLGTGIFPVKAQGTALKQLSQHLGKAYQNGVAGIVWEKFCAPDIKPIWLSCSTSVSEAESAARLVVGSWMRLLPGGMTRVIYCDPVNRGTGIGVLNHLLGGDDGKSSRGGLVLENVATTPQEISQALQMENNKLGEIGTKLGSIRSVAEYNDIAFKNGAPTLPYTLIVVDRIESDSVDPASLKALSAIADNMGRFGYGLFIIEGPRACCADDKRRTEALEGLKSRATVLKQTKGSEFRREAGGSIRLFQDNSGGVVNTRVDRAFVDEFLKAYDAWENTPIVCDASRFIDPEGDAVGGRRTISSAINGDITIPFAVASDNSLAKMSFGKFPNISTLITGSVRSGKTVCLHTLITQLAATFSPEELELWLVDFKGTEFTRYRNNPLPHVRLIGLTEDPYFTDALLDKIDEEFSQRKEYLQKAFVGKVDDYNNLSNKPDGCPDYLRHIVLIIDEFGVMSDFLRKTRDKRLDNALRVYPALGLYCLFANQSVTLNDSNLFGADAAAQITGRVGFYNSNTGEFRKLFPFDFCGRDSGGSLPESYQMSDHRCILYDGSTYTLCKPVFYTTQKEAKPGEVSDLERVVNRCATLYGKSSDCFVMSECERSNLNRN